MGHEPGEDTHAVVYMRPWTAIEMQAVTEGLTWADWLSVNSLAPILRSSTP